MKMQWDPKLRQNNYNIQTRTISLHHAAMKTGPQRTPENYREEIKTAARVTIHDKIVKPAQTTL